MRKLRAYPSDTSRTSPRRPTEATSSSRMTFMLGVLVRRHVRQQGHRARALDRVGQLPLMPRAAAGDAARNDLAALGHEAAEATHVFVVDEVDLVRAELANLPASKATPLDWLLSWGNGSPPLFARRRLERDVVLAALALVTAERRRRGRNRRRRAARALGAAHELNALGDHLRRRALLPVLAFPVARLQPAFHEDLAALVEILTARLGLLAPHHHREEADLLTLLPALRRVIPVDCQAQVGDRGTAWRVAQLRGTRQITDQEHLVQARHQPTSSTTSAGALAVDRAFFRIGTRVERKRSTFSLRRSWRSNSFTMAGSADTSKTAYVPSRCLRMSYDSRRLPQFSILATSAPSDLTCSPSCVSSSATSSSAGRGSTITRIS